MDREIKLVETGCHGMCEMGPIVVVYPEGTFYCRVEPEDVAEIVEEHLYKGRLVQRLLYKTPVTPQGVPHYKEIPFYSKQVRIALANCGYINPNNIEEYIARDGYVALAKALKEMSPEDVLQEVKTSGLRGRGGGGFPTGLKWEFCRKAAGTKKYTICNADEGDPGAFMDRSILEGDPHAVIEGMMLGAYAMGADEGYIYCRPNIPGVQALNEAILQAVELGLLGDNVLDTSLSFHLM
jgi:NADH:ubiquinone oxidoreductase subunit F (NADH-binding)/(2Fe-2S) ferredoxin